jgi:NOL1/NOP2/fmu family ribosome biogenesis protein
LAYLRREAINVPDGAPKGFNLLTYRNHPLGFIKNIGNRVNNLYPQQWRILSTAVPAEPPVILD